MQRLLLISPRQQMSRSSISNGSGLLMTGTLLALDRVWMPATIGAPLLKVDFSHTALYDEMAKHVDISFTVAGKRSVP